MRRLNSIFTIMLLCSIGFSCAHGSKMKKLSPGMRKKEVINILGRPDGYKTSGEYEALKYANKLMSGWSWDRADYYAILKKSILVEYGAGEIREKENNIIVLVPIR